MVDASKPPLESGAWLPVHSEWQERRMHWLRDFRDGLAAAGVDVRIDVVGAPGLELSILWARSPAPLVESAEEWLLRRCSAAERRGEPWAVIDTVLAQRWRRFRVWRGEPDEFREWNRRRTRDWPFLGPRIVETLGAHKDTAAVSTFPRSTAEVLELVAAWTRRGPSPMPHPYRWVALDEAVGVTEVARLSELQRGMESLGIETCRYEADDGARAILLLHAERGSLDDLEQRIESAVPSPAPAWWARYRPWSWDCGIKVHRERERAPREIVAQIDAALGAPVTFIWGATEGEVVVSVPVRFVERALTCLERWSAG